ncbi:transcription initiation factor TFIID subunit 4 isoform X2 [Iris pallida]|uniref:Transcription initiation factor TFIID subunit 4 isoform X2 n=1 Tax=Iris pallida TaxID=29817 RepID=A0AAX6HDJ5_IRIPA|nr:transcription initiation factor TFIID subunit 4 isoform X2 [Iris pallida]KAJ6853657.1 transcription initiation factor TFIID subunit 4 isoform X2 [Iris pallida]
MSTAKDHTAADRQHRHHRRRRLHNFSFPNQVSWGSRRLLRCKSPVTAAAAAAAAATASPVTAPSSEAPAPWNLRTRRSTCDSPAAAEAPPEQNPNPKERGRADFSVELSFEEIEEDFVRMKGRKPYRRPKKRPRSVQKKLDSLFPGLWLEEITADSYKTND